MKKRETLKNAAFFAVILILVLVFLISGLHILESTVLQNGDIQETTGKKTIVRNGVEYFPRQDITVMLVMGIDGRPAGNNFGQLALSHTFGNGLERSCENVKKTVSDFLYGLQIDYYVSMNMDAIATMNDAVGGVKVTVTEDFSKVDPTIPMGEVILRGQQAINYVRTRKNVGDQLNLSRIERQKDYIQGFFTAFKASAQNANFLVDAYEEISPYIVTDCSTNALSGIVSRYEDYDLRQIVPPQGRECSKQRILRVPCGQRSAGQTDPGAVLPPQKVNKTSELCSEVFYWAECPYIS